MPKNLLLADDSITIQKVVGITFANEDYKVTSVDNGEDAIARARDLKPDVILADVVMPRKNGYEVCEAVKSDPSLRHIPVLLLAGTFEAFDEARARAARADGHIGKPFESQALINKVNELVTGKPAAAAPGAPAGRPAAPPAPRPPAPAAAGGMPPRPAAPPPGAIPPGARPSAPGMPAARPPGAPPPGVQPRPGPYGTSAGLPPGGAMPPPGARPPGAPPPGMQARPGAVLPGARPPGPPGGPPPGVRPPPGAMAPPGAQRPGMPPPAPRPPGPAPGVPRPPAPVVPPAAARPAAPAPARPAAPAPSARRDVFGFGTPEAAPAPRPAPAPPPAAAPADDDWSDLTSSATPGPLAAPEPIELGGDESEPELAPMHEFVPPAATTGHAPAAAPARAAPAPASADGGEAALRAALSGVSREVIERVVWEVVPQLAETIIRENLDRLVKNRQG